MIEAEEVEEEDEWDKNIEFVVAKEVTRPSQPEGEQVFVAPLAEAAKIIAETAPMEQESQLPKYEGRHDF